VSIHYFPPQGGGGGGGGTITGGSNVGGGADVFKTVSGTNLVFRSMVDSATIGWTQNTNDLVASFIGDSDDVPEGATNLYCTYANINAEINAPNDSFIFSDNTGQIVGYTQWGIDATTKFSNVSLNYEPNNLSATPTIHNWYSNINPQQDSPNDNLIHHNVFLNFDELKSGFDFGGVTLLNLGFNYFGDASEYGNVIAMNVGGTVGDGTDPVTIGAYTASNINFQVANNATIDGGVQGYGFSFNTNAGATTTSNVYVTGFSDYSTVNSTVYSYQSFAAGPQIDTIANNTGYSGLNLNPTIDNFAGNAGASGININGTYSNFSTGSFTGINVNPTIPVINTNARMMDLSGQSTSGTADWNGINISSANIVTTGVKRGLTIGVAHELTSFALEATGHCALTSEFPLISGQTQMYGHVIGGQVIVPDATAITGTDVLANNMAFTVDLGDATSSFTSAGPVALTTLGFVGQIIGDGDADTINFCLNGYNPIVNGTVDRVNNFSALCIPNSGSGVINEGVLYYGDGPFGLSATDMWGLRIEDSTAAGLENYLTRLLVGTASARKVTNASCGIELNSTTQAVKTATMTTAQKTALTAVDGMWVYDSDLDQHQFRENGAWVGLSGVNSIAPSTISSINSNTSAVNKTIYLVDTSGGAVTVTLPAPTNGAIVVVKDTGSAQTNNISVAPNGAEDIDGVNASYVIDANFESDTFVSNGTDWFVL